MTRGMDLVAEFIKQIGASPLAQHDSIKVTVFRGHADCDWKLVPSISRPDAPRGIHNRLALERWMRFAAPVVTQWPQSRIDWIALAQHNGVATCLLDWTLNPLTALYFACCARHRRDGCVWILDTTECEQINHTSETDPFEDRSNLGFLPLLAANTRARAQFGVMTLHPNSKPNAADLLPREALKKIPVTASDKDNVLRALGILGITARTIFADLPSAATDFNSRFTK